MKEGEVTFRVTREEGGPQLVVSGRGVRVTKRVTKDTISIRVEAAGDTVQLETDMAGSATLRRNGKARRLLGYDPKVGLPEGMKPSEAWVRSKRLV